MGHGLWKYTNSFFTDLNILARRSIGLLTIVAVALAGCSNYKAVLQYPSGEKAEGGAADVGADDPRFVLPADFEPGPSTVLKPPAPVKAERVVRGEPKLAQHSGWVHLRFDVDSMGNISGVEVVRRSSAEREFAARRILSDWEFTPATVDAQPVAFENMEVVMGFSETVTVEEAVGKGAAVIVLLPLALIALAIGTAVGVSGSN